jgi:hypothetical protein
MKINHQNTMKTLLAAAGIWAGVSLSANATLTWTSPLHLNDHDVVGIMNGLAGDNPGNDEPYFAQEILNLTANTLNFSFTDSSSGVAHLYSTSSTEYSGTVIHTGTHQGSDNNVPAGYDYVIAKYDGKNAGYVLFHLGGQAATIPEYSYSIWGADAGQYQISGYTAFDVTSDSPQVPEPTTVIAGALLLLPFGASTIRVLRNRRA